MIKEVLNEITSIQYGLDWGKDISLPKKYNNKSIIKYLWKRIENFVIANSEKLYWGKVGKYYTRYIEDLNYGTKWMVKIWSEKTAWAKDGVIFITITEHNKNLQSKSHISMRQCLYSYTFGVSVIIWLQDTLTKILRGEI